MTDVSIDRRLPEKPPAKERQEPPAEERFEEVQFRRDLIALIPQLRALARVMCGNPSAADDLVQNALLKAWKGRRGFCIGTNLKAWLYTILRNQFYSDHQRHGRRQAMEGPISETAVAVPAAQESKVVLADLQSALLLLPPAQREALIMVGAGGVAYEEAADLCNCAVGTIKSRVARARARLVDCLSGSGDRLSRRCPSSEAASSYVERELHRLARQRSD